MLVIEIMAIDYDREYDRDYEFEAIAGNIVILLAVPGVPKLLRAVRRSYTVRI